jgi:hypothetical protein
MWLPFIRKLSPFNKVSFLFAICENRKRNEPEGPYMHLNICTCKHASFDRFFAHQKMTKPISVTAAGKHIDEYLANIFIFVWWTECCIFKNISCRHWFKRSLPILFFRTFKKVLCQKHIAISLLKTTNEPCHDKTNIMGLRPAWIQTSLRIRAVCSGFMLLAYKPYSK